jgi:hypothetical protein
VESEARGLGLQVWKTKFIRQEEEEDGIRIVNWELGSVPEEIDERFED